MIVSDKVCLSIALTSNLSYHLPWLKKFPEKGFRTMAFLLGFPGGTSGKEPDCQCRRCKRLSFSPCLGKIPQRRVWQPTPVFLPRESHGQRSLMGYSPQTHKESDMTEATQHTLIIGEMQIKTTMRYYPILLRIVVVIVQSLSHVQLFATPWTAACQASLSITNSRSLLKLM